VLTDKYISLNIPIVDLNGTVYGDPLWQPGKALETGTYWSGLIDDVRIYNQVVTP